jgi:carbonic anhydrase/acetyltransferase-like protein (isoleucine patch superfamily)
MMNDSLVANRARLERLTAKGVHILAPESVIVGEEVNLDNVEATVVVGPGTKILGAETMIGAGTEIQGAAIIKNSLIGRNCNLAAGEYVDSVLLDRCSTAGWARLRGHSAWEEESNSAHNVDTKTTLLGYKTTLGSLINFCNVLMLGGTSPRLEVGAEVGSGTINFNFLPFGATVGALIKPSTVVGSIESPFLVCDGAPTRYTFIGGHSSIVPPVMIGLGTVVAAKSRVNPGIYGDDKLIGGGNIEKPLIVDVSRVRVLKDQTAKYKILIRQMATTAAFRKWCNLRVSWAKRNKLDEFEVRLIEGFAVKVDKYMEALEAYGNNIAKYLLASDDNSRPESLEKNKAIARRWNEKVKAQFKAAEADETGYAEATAGLNTELDRVTQEGSDGDKQFYDAMAKLSYLSTEVKTASEYFSGLVETIVRQASI